MTIPTTKPPVAPFEVAGLSREGRRASNEDSAAWAAFAPDASIAAYALVCDGMGGHNAGEVASAMALRYMQARIAELAADPAAFTGGEGPLKERLERWVVEVNKQIREKGSQNVEQRGMGTTLAAAFVSPEGKLVAANVGDSKIFVVRGVLVEQVSVDHTALAEQRRVLGVDSMAPEDVAGNPFAHALTRSLGQEHSVAPDVRSDVVLKPGDLVIVTSDGVTDVLESERFLTIVESCRSLGEICESIFQQAFDAGSKDNITIALVAWGRPTRLGTAADRPRTPDEEDPFDETRPLIRAPKAARPVSEGSSVADGGGLAEPSLPARPAAAKAGSPRPLASALAGLPRWAPVAGLALAALVVLAILSLVLVRGGDETAPPEEPRPGPTAVAEVRPTAVPTVAPEPTPAPAFRPEDVPVPSETREPVATARPAGPLPTMGLGGGPGAGAQRPVEPRATPAATSAPGLDIPSFRVPPSAPPAARPEPTAVPAKPTAVPAIVVPTSPPPPPEVAIHPREAKLERAKVSVDAARRYYFFHFVFDQPVRGPKQADDYFELSLPSITVVSRDGKRLTGGVDRYVLRHFTTEGKALIYRLTVSNTDFKGDKVLTPGDRLRIVLGGSSNPFAKEVVEAEVF